MLLAAFAGYLCVPSQPISASCHPDLTVAAAAAAYCLLLWLPVAADISHHLSSFKPSSMLHTTTIPTICSVKKHSAIAPIIIPAAVVASCSSLLLQLYTYHMYTIQVTKAALSRSKSINDRRKDRGLQPRPVRAAVIGFPNVAKSALINRFLNRRVCESVQKPGDWIWISNGHCLAHLLSFYKLLQAG